MLPVLHTAADTTCIVYVCLHHMYVAEASCLYVMIVLDCVAPHAVGLTLEHVCLPAHLGCCLTPHGTVCVTDDAHSTPQHTHLYTKSQA
jgi:hypothetical protein